MTGAGLQARGGGGMTQKAWAEAQLPGEVMSLARGPAGNSVDSEHLSELREDFPRPSGAKGLGPRSHDPWKEGKGRALETSIRLSTNKTTPTLRTSPRV